MKENQFIQGEKYSIVTKNSKSPMIGVYVFEDDEFYFFKLSSGYNVGVKKRSIKSSNIVEENKSKLNNDEKKQKIIVESPQIMILHTGGTIASKVDYSTGAVNAKFTPDEMLDLFPELRTLGEIDSFLVSNMPSDDLNFSHYNKMGHAIERALLHKSLKGIILTHGTDTLHYTASALSFMLENISIPIVLVGSQRSSDRPSSDAALNLLSAAYFINEAKNNSMKGVFICMHESNDDDYCSILSAHNVRKMHSSRRDAFKPINSQIVARVNFEKKKIDILSKKSGNNSNNSNSIETSKFLLKPFNPEIKVGIIRSRPSMHPEEFKAYQKFDGLILEGTGLGHFPIQEFDDETKINTEIFNEIKKIAKKKIACMTTQTIYGRVNLNVYSPGRMLKDAGVLGHNLDMTTETAYIKLAWLLSNYKEDKKEVKKLYSENIRGEISLRTQREEFS